MYFNFHKFFAEGKNCWEEIMKTSFEFSNLYIETNMK